MIIAIIDFAVGSFYTWTQTKEYEFYLKYNQEYLVKEHAKMTYHKFQIFVSPWVVSTSGDDNIFTGFYVTWNLYGWFILHSYCITRQIVRCVIVSFPYDILLSPFD